MKPIKLFIVAVTSFVVLAGCNNSTTTADNEKSADTSNSGTSNTAQDETNKMDHTTPASGLMSSMNSMMERMKAMKMSGDFDIDFANMMIEHHQGAIDMSQQEVSSGKDQKLKGLAQTIIDKQKKEISDLQDFVKTYKPSGMKHGKGELEKSMSNMETKMKSIQMSGDIDKDFAMMMISHHQSAIDMAKMELKNGMSDQLKQMAQKTIDDQTKEIKDFQTWLNSNK